MNKQYDRLYLARFCIEDAKLIELAEEYIKRTDEYDSKILSGKTHSGIRVPANGFEYSESSRNAMTVFDEILIKAECAGFSKKRLLGKIQALRKQ